ncbi:hypothetical protein PoB_002325700 [Plakobranchus ocellatus]|uniref:Uncharacterized protein n=1 Tax=Plakobranchus ocellatus TaxID=259542 RepID=A0AAV3ZNH1_9GAST|nr:hypothetical protein PoB_002325700 [Plakobranchus ocellatus]
MTDIRCPVPQCGVSWPSTTASEVLLKLLDMHERIAHPSTTPTTASMTRGSKQRRDEPERAFSARLKGQANVCQYNIPCKCGAQLSYSDQMVRDILIVGLADEDIRLDVLGQANQEMSLEETIRFIEAKESGKRSAGRINPKPTAVLVAVDAASSTYKQIERRRLQGEPPDRKAITQKQLCGHCGKAGHSSKKQERMNHCPAFNHICNNCNLPHHFESVCRKSRQKQRTNQSNSATAVFETLCSIEQFACTITLDHHVYDSLCDVWGKTCIYTPTNRQRGDPGPSIRCQGLEN